MILCKLVFLPVISFVKNISYMDFMTRMRYEMAFEKSVHFKQEYVLHLY
jgi:hypothetical protein